ncbi:MAG: phosphoribosylformimino-5-aminoimidazole carboxamide ribotide isomerase, partial [Actinomycetota bacterium]
IPVIASGGVGALVHLTQLAEVSGLNGVIVGKAIYEGKFTVAEAVAVLQ